MSGSKKGLRIIPRHSVWIEKGNGFAQACNQFYSDIMLKVKDFLCRMVDKLEPPFILLPDGP